MSKEQLIIKARVVRDEIIPDANTAYRVGSLLEDIIEEMNTSGGGSGTVSFILFNKQTSLVPNEEGVISVEAFPIDVHVDVEPFMVAKKGSIVRIIGTGTSHGTYSDYVCLQDYNDTPGGNDDGGVANTDFFMPWVEFVDRVKSSAGSLKIDGLELFPTPGTNQISFSIDSKIGIRIDYWVSELPSAETAEVGKKYYSSNDNHLWIISTNNGAHWVDRGAVSAGNIYLYVNDNGDDLKYICDEDSGTLYPLMFLSSMINKIEKVSVDGEELAIDTAKGIDVPVDTRIGLPVNIVNSIDSIAINIGEFYYALDTNHIHIQPSSYAPVLDRGLAYQGVIYISKPDRNKYKFDGTRLTLIGDLSDYQKIADNLMEILHAKTTTTHPHWISTSNGNLYRGEDKFNLNLIPSAYIRYDNGQGDYMGTCAYMLLADSSSTSWGVDNNSTNHANDGKLRITSNHKRNGLTSRFVRPSTLIEQKYADGTIIQNAYKDFDGNLYTGAKIGTQVWMRENLKTTHFENGDPIVKQTIAQWIAAPTTSLVGYTVKNFAESIADVLTSEQQVIDIYGLYYNWYTIQSASGIVNSANGWKVPSIADVNTLATYIKTNYPQYTDANIANALSSTIQIGSTFTDDTMIEPTMGRKMSASDVKGIPVMNTDYLANKTIQLPNITILNSGWTPNGNGWQYVVSNARIKASHYADFIPITQESVVLQADIQNNGITADGSLTIYANVKPSADFVATILLRD
jgi:uncharacterized protein (TIGR02145 family)